MIEISTDEVRKIQLDILSAVDEFCTHNNIIYFLSYGSLLGAIRHRGYIPWDDDIDITMPYPYYIKFIKEFNHEYYRVNSILKNLDYPYHLVKIDDKRTKLIEPVDNSYDIGVSIDLSPLIGLPSNKFNAVRHFNRIDFWRSKILLSKNVIMKKRNIIKNASIYAIKKIPISRKQIIEHINFLSSEYEYDYSKYVICVGSFNQSNEIASKQLFSSVCRHEFENRLFCIPTGWDKWLNTLFGDYMKLPPSEYRVSHHSFSCYWR